MPVQKEGQASRVELHQLAVEHPLVGIHAHLHRPQVHGVNLDENGCCHEVPAAPFRLHGSAGVTLLLGQDLDLAGTSVELVGHLVVVDEVDPANTEHQETENSQNRQQGDPAEHVAQEVPDPRLDLTDLIHCLTSHVFKGLVLYTLWFDTVRTKYNSIFHKPCPTSVRLRLGITKNMALVSLIFSELSDMCG